MEQGKIWVANSEPLPGFLTVDQEGNLITVSAKDSHLIAFEDADGDKEYVLVEARIKKEDKEN